MQIVHKLSSYSESDLGAVYTCNSGYELLYDSVYDLLHKVVCNLIVNQFLLICVNKQL
jgi:hypothetical protein